MTVPPAPGPLAGILVADCSTVLAGPYCTMLLGDLGANVVKVEPPEGDATRGWGPPWVAPGIDGSDDPGTAAYFLAANRNKRSIRLDLRGEAGRDVLRRLLVRSDVVVENFRVGGFARLGFDDAALEALNPRLVHLAISGYGPTGPEASSPGYDFIVQAVSGLMSITGAPDAEGGAAHQDRRRGERPDDRHARCLGRRRGARRPRSARIAGGRSWPADRHLPARVDALVAREPGPELLRHRHGTDAPRQRAPEHRPVRNVRDSRRMDRRCRGQRAPVGALLLGTRCALAHG